MQECGKDCVWVKPSDWIKQNKLDYLEVKDEGEFETLLYDTRYNIRFKCDGIIRYKGTYYILEIKTETERKMLIEKMLMMGIEINLFAIRWLLISINNVAL